MNSCRLVPGRVVDVHPALILVQHQVQVIRRIERRADVHRGAGAGPRVREIDFLSGRAVHRHGRQQSRGAELRRVPELSAADRSVADADVVVDVAELHEAVPARVHRDARLNVSADQFAGAIDLTIDVHECAQLRDEAGRPEGPSGSGRRFAVSDLRHEPRLGAEPVPHVLEHRG